MHLTDWIALAVALVGGGGLGTGGVKIVGNLTRLIVAVESLVKTVETIITDVKGLSGSVQSHETRLTVHDTQIATLQHQAAVQALPPAP